MNTTQKRIKRMIDNGILKPLKERPAHYEVIAVSTGVNGLNGCIIKNLDNNELLGLASRSMLLLSIV